MKESARKNTYLRRNHGLKQGIVSLGKIKRYEYMTRHTKIRQFNREMQQTVPETGPEFLNNSREPQSRQKNRLRSDFSSFLSPVSRSSPLHGEEERENQPSRRRKQEPIGCERERGNRQMDRWARREEIQIERGGSVESVGKKRRKRMGGGNFVKREREKDRGGGGVWW